MCDEASTCDMVLQHELFKTGSTVQFQYSFECSFGHTVGNPQQGRQAVRQICIDMMAVVQNDIWMSDAAQARLRYMSIVRQDEFVSATPSPLTLFLARGESGVKERGMKSEEVASLK